MTKNNIQQIYDLFIFFHILTTYFSHYDDAFFLLLLAKCFVLPYLIKTLNFVPLLQDNWDVVVTNIFNVKVKSISLKQEDFFHPGDSCCLC